jgi:uncharacterized OsmC-like protein
MGQDDRAAPVDRGAVSQLMRNREAPPDEEFVFGAERVTIELEGHGNGPFHVRKRDFAFVVDEPPDRGGTDSGPNPLAYFLAGAATCLCSHYMLNAIDDGVPIESLKVNARGHFNRAFYGGRFRDVIYDVRIESPADAATVKEMVQRAEEMCYAHNTLLAAGVKMTTNVKLNGAELVSLVKGGEEDG